MRAPFDAIQSVGVFQGAFLAAIPDYIPHAHNTDQTIRQNLTLVLFYNIAAVPLPFWGCVTPLIAPFATSSSSILVIVDALQLGHSRHS